MRNFFLVFPIKGETESLERILIGFSEKYAQDNSNLNIDADKVFTLNFAIMMLNTD